jgi:hypothetical protein
MPKKDPVRGMEPMSEYTRVRGSDLEPSKMDKALDVAGSGLALAGLSSLPIYAAKRMSDAKKKTDEQEKRQKSGMELEVENAKKDRRVKEEQEAYEKYDKNRLKDQGSFKKGGSVKSASARADGIAKRGKTRGKIV